MLQVSIVVRPRRAEILCQRLLASGLIQDLTAVECRGYGRQKGHLENYSADEYRIDFLPKVLVQGRVEDADLDRFIDLATTTCRTGRIGDGKIFVQRVIEELSI